MKKRSRVGHEGGHRNLLFQKLTAKHTGVFLNIVERDVYLYLYRWNNIDKERAGFGFLDSLDRLETDEET